MSKSLIRLTNFNPRSREGSDVILVISQHCFAISIHAPARGATRLVCCRRLAEEFQSTLPRGERPAHSGCIHHDSVTFQSTLPRGERRTCFFLPLVHQHFNPRSREGSDWSSNDDGSKTAISIHAPARGATTALISYFISPENFNPRSREGSDETIF